MDWKPMKVAPYQQVIEVRNPQMDKPVLATRGYATEAGVHPNDTYCTSVFTPETNDWESCPAGRLVCPTEWREAPAETQ